MFLRHHKIIIFAFLSFFMFAVLSFAMEINDQITEEMINYFENRTNSHIKRVKENMLLMVGFFGLSKEILEMRGNDHDKSKFFSPEKDGYIWLTWWHACKNNNTTFNYTDEIQNLVIDACKHHLAGNLHHPESHNNPNDMLLIDMVEMVCDWTAMSQEYGKKNCLEWVHNNIAKWGFSEEKKADIFAIIEELNLRLDNSNNNS